MREVSRIPTDLMRAYEQGQRSVDDTIPLIGDETHENSPQEPEKENSERRNGYLGWVAVAAAVGAWDMSKNETMTSAYYRGTQSNIGKMAIWGATAYTVAHLNRKIPQGWDAFDGIANLIGRLRGE